MDCMDLMDSMDMRRRDVSLYRAFPCLAAALAHRRL